MIVYFACSFIIIISYRISCWNWRSPFTKNYYLWLIYCICCLTATIIFFFFLIFIFVTSEHDFGFTVLLGLLGLFGLFGLFGLLGLGSLGLFGLLQLLKQFCLALFFSVVGDSQISSVRLSVSLDNPSIFITFDLIPKFFNWEKKSIHTLLIFAPKDCSRASVGVLCALPAMGSVRLLYLSIIHYRIECNKYVN